MSSFRTCILFIISSLSVCAQRPFEHLTTSDGLSQSTVWDIAQDRKGFVWLATADGLNRYDGYAFKVFRNQPGQKNTLPTSNIATVYADRHNTIWVGPRNSGLCRLREDGETFDHYALDTRGRRMDPSSVTSFVEADDRLWVGTSENGLFYFDYRTKKVVRWNDSRIGKSVTALFRDENGTVWIGVKGGKLFAFTPRTGHLLVYPIPFAEETADIHRAVSVILKDRRGCFWVGTSGQGLFHFDPVQKSFKRVYYKPGVYETYNLIVDVVEDKRGTIWVTTDYGALLFPDGDLSRQIMLLPDAEKEKSMSTHALKRALCDAEGNIWIGSWQGGVNIHYAQPERFVSVRHQPHNPQSLLAARVTSVAADRQGGLWAGSTKGLTYLAPDQKTFRRFTSRNSLLASTDISSLYTTPAGNILISTWAAGFAYYNVQTNRFRPFSTMGVSKSVKVFATARAGKVWIGTHEKELFLFDERTGRLEPIDLSPLFRSRPSFDINAVCEDSNGNLWIGTYNSGLICWNRAAGRIRNFTSDGNPTSLGSNSIVSIYEDSRKRLWVGTNGGGLNHYHPRTETFTAYTTKNGLSNNFIAGIVEDRRQTLWLSTNGGIICFDPDRATVENYYQSDGLVGKEFLPGACAALPSGALAFGNMQGLVVFRPERVREKFPPPRVYLSELKLFNRPVIPAGEDAPAKVDMTDAETLVFKPSQAVFTLDFTALSFLPHRNIRYAFLLEGFDPDWNYVGFQRSATYTNLPHGTYTFLVKAAVGNSDWSRPRAVQVVVLPPWYRTWWAYLLYGLVFLGILYALRRIILIRERLKADIRIKQLETESIKALDDAKTSFFTNISHEFRTPLTLILTPLEKLIAEGGFEVKMQHQFQTIQRNAHRLLRLINQLLDLSKLESRSLLPDISRNDLVPFMEGIVHYFDELAESKRISLLFKSNFDSMEGFFDPDIVEKILYNLLSNAIKFTPEGGEVRVNLDFRLTSPDKKVLLTVEDTGIGMSAENLTHIFERFYQVSDTHTQKKSGSGIGLALTRELVELHRGRIEVRSTEKKGTAFTVTLPVDETQFPKEWLSGDRESPTESNQPILPTVVPEGVAVSSPKSLPVLLIVEDNEELRQYLRECLSGSYHVLTAADGPQALVQAQRHIPDLILSDWLMPGMDGTELCQAIRANEKTSHIPFLLLTSRSANQSQVIALETGIDDYMTKPFHLSILESKVKNLIRNRQLLRENYARQLAVAPSGLNLPPLEEQFIQKAIAIIEAHLDDSHFDTDQLGDALNMSRMQFYRKLKGLVNLSGTEFIRRIRLKRAVQLLESGYFNISEVAYQVGFNDPAYFSRCFKKEYGKPPQEYLAKT